MLTLQGTGTSPGRVAGPLRRNREDLTPGEAAGAVLVAGRAVPDDVGRILAAAGTLTLTGSFLSHVSLLAREFGRPSVSLGAAARARIVAGPRPALLSLADVVGAGGPVVLDEGDVVLLDGEAGTVRIPGGADPEARRRAAGAHGPLAVFAARGDEAALRELAAGLGGPDDPVLAYVLDAAIAHGLVAPGGPSRRLLDALRAVPALRDAVEGRAAALAARLRAEAAARIDRFQQTVEGADRIEDLDRQLRALQEAVSRDEARLADLEGGERALHAIAEPVLERAERRAALLRRGVVSEVQAALALPEDALAGQLGRLFRIVRRARAAGLEEPPVAALHVRLIRVVARERERSGEPLVIPLEGGPGRPDRSLVGGKAAGLFAARGLLPAGARIPRGFVVTTAAYRLHLLGETGDRLHEAAATAADEAEASRRARAALLGGEIPAEVAEAVDRAAAALGAERLAVRSSATIEDGAVGSLAGQFDSWLGVRPGPELRERVRQAWASLWNARAVRTLAAAGRSPLGAAQAVIVQEIVPTRAAGVLLSRDPTGRPGVLLVNAAWGLGEAIAQGEIAGDLSWVERSTGRLLAFEAGAGTTALALDPERTGTVEVALPEEWSGRPCLDETELARLAELARAIEEATGRDQDIEFGFDRSGGLLVFQVRRVVRRRG